MLAMNGAKQASLWRRFQKDDIITEKAFSLPNAALPCIKEMENTTGCRYTMTLELLLLNGNECSYSHYLSQKKLGVHFRALNVVKCVFIALHCIGSSDFIFLRSLSLCAHRPFRVQHILGLTSWYHGSGGHSYDCWALPSLQVSKLSYHHFGGFIRVDSLSVCLYVKKQPLCTWGVQDRTNEIFVPFLLLVGGTVEKAKSKQQVLKRA